MSRDRKPVEILALRVVMAAMLVSLSGGANAAGGAADTEFRRAERLTADPGRGAELFQTCAACHGADGGGIDDGSVPAIAGQQRRVILKQLVDFRHGKRWDIRMEHFADRHRLPEAQQLADLAGYVAALPPTSHPKPGDAEALRRGASLYVTRCGECHGATGEGDDAALVPRLAGQHAAYLVRQLYDAVDGRRPNMSGAHARRFEPLEREDIVGMADYLSRMMGRRPAP